MTDIHSQQTLSTSVSNHALIPKAVAIHALSLKGPIGLTNQACWLGILLTFEILLTWIVDSCNVLMYF